MARTAAVTSEQDKSTPEQRRASRQRLPFGIPRSKLSVYKEVPGYHLHWVNDEAGRIYAAEQGGYEFVEPQEVGVDTQETRVKVLVGKTESGDGLFAYLMKIRQEWYEEDQEEIQSQIDSIEYAMKKGTFESEPGQNRYVPTTGIKISSKTER